MPLPEAITMATFSADALPFDSTILSLQGRCHSRGILVQAKRMINPDQRVPPDEVAPRAFRPSARSLVDCLRRIKPLTISPTRLCRSRYALCPQRDLRQVLQQSHREKLTPVAILGQCPPMDLLYESRDLQGNAI